MGQSSIIGHLNLGKNGTKRDVFYIYNIIKNYIKYLL